MLEAGWVSLLAYVPLALRAYWALAAGAALLALSPVRLAPAFRRGRSTPGAAAQRLLGSPGRALEVKAVSDLARPGRDLGLRARGGRAAVVLSACRGKTWDAKPAAALGPLTVRPRRPAAPAPARAAAPVLSRTRSEPALPRTPRRVAPGQQGRAAQGLSVPQSWFAHFYDVGAATNAAVLAGLLALTAAPAARPRPHGLAQLDGADAALAALGLLQLHLCRRLAEANWLARYPPGARMHVIAYAFGLRRAPQRPSAAGGGAGRAGGVLTGHRGGQHASCLSSCRACALSSGTLPHAWRPRDGLGGRCT